MTYTKEQLGMLKSAMEGFIEIQSLHTRMLPPIPESSKLGEWFGAYSSQAVATEREAMLDQKKTAVSNATVAIRLIDQLLPLVD